MLVAGHVRRRQVDGRDRASSSGSPSSGYQFCIIDPEGDYEGVSTGAVVARATPASARPTVEEVLELLAAPDRNVVVNLLGHAARRAPALLRGAAAAGCSRAARAHRPAALDRRRRGAPPAAARLAGDRRGAAATIVERLLLVTVHPNTCRRRSWTASTWCSRSARDAGETLRAASRRRVGGRRPTPATRDLEPGEVLVWTARGGAAARCACARSRRAASASGHVRKYAEGELGPDKSFYFRGPDGRAEPARAEPEPVPAGRPTASTTTRGCTTCARATTRAGSARRSRTRSSPATSLPSRRPRGLQPDLSAAESRAQIRAAIEARYTASA